MAALEMALWAHIVAACGNGVAPELIDSLALGESGRNPSAVHHNRNGTVDIGIMQMNEINWHDYGLTGHTAKNPCRSVDAASRKLIADAGGVDALKSAVVQRLLRALRLYNPGDPQYATKTLARIPQQKKAHHAISLAGRPSSQRYAIMGR